MNDECPAPNFEDDELFENDPPTMLLADPSVPGSVRVVRSGSRLTIGFHCQDAAEYLICIPSCRSRLMDLIRDPECRTVAVDLERAKSLLSGMLGLFANIIKLGRELEVMNASEETLEVLRLTGLDAHVFVSGIAAVHPGGLALQA